MNRRTVLSAALPILFAILMFSSPLGTPALGAPSSSTQATPSPPATADSLGQVQGPAGTTNLSLPASVSAELSAEAQGAPSSSGAAPTSGSAEVTVSQGSIVLSSTVSLGGAPAPGPGGTGPLASPAASPVPSLPPSDPAAGTPAGPILNTSQLPFAAPGQPLPIPTPRTDPVSSSDRADPTERAAAAGAHPYPGTASLTAITPDQGPDAGAIDLSGTGFLATSSISFTIGGYTAASSCSSDDSGTFTDCVVTLPRTLSAGSQPVVASDGTNSASGAFLVTTPSITAVPSEAPNGATVTVSGSGFSVDSPVTLYFTEVPITSCATGSLTTGASGTFSCAFRSPPPGESPVVEGSFGTGPGPYAAAYDPQNDYLYVANYQSPYNVSVYYGTTPVASLTVGYYPIAATYDPVNGYVYVLNYYGASVSVLGGTSIVGTVDLPSSAYPFADAVDTENGDVYVVSSGAGVAVISGTALIGLVGVGTIPYYPAYDGANGDVYVPNEGSANVSVLSGARVLQTLSAPTSPEFATFDPGNAYVYVATAGGAVAVYDGAATVTTIAGSGTASMLVYDPGDGDLYLGSSGAYNLTVINGTSIIGYLPSGIYPVGAAYDPLNGYLYVPSYTGNVTVVTGTRSVGALGAGDYPYYAVYDAYTGTVDVPNYYSNNVTEYGGVNSTEVGAAGPVGPTAYASFTSTTPALQLTPAAGTVGAGFTVSGTGFTPSGAATVSFGGTLLAPNGCSDGGFAGTTISLDASGDFACSFSVPDDDGGSYAVVGADLDSGVSSAAEPFTLEGPTLALSASSGPVGSPYTVDGTYFTASSGATVSFAGVLQTPTSCSVGTFTGSAITTSGGGEFACAFTVPSESPASYSIVGFDEGSSTSTAANPFAVTVPAVTPDPVRGFVGGDYVVTGTGFTAGSPAVVLLDANAQSATSCSQGLETGGAITTNSTGGFVCTFTVPELSQGSYPLEGEDSRSSTFSPAFSFLVEVPRLSVSPRDGPAGASVVVSGVNFSPNSAVDLTFRNQPVSACLSGSLATDASGDFTCTVQNPATVSVAGTVPDLYYAYGTTFDPYNGYDYVAGYYYDTVWVLDGTVVIGSVAVGAYPAGPMAVDPYNGWVYVPSSQTGIVTVISGTSVVGYVTVGSIPYFALYDAADGDVYILNNGGASVSVINGTTVVATVDVGVNPTTAVFDPANGDVYVSNLGSASVSVVYGSSVVASIPVGSYPGWGTYDSANGDVYVPNTYSSNVSVIHGDSVVSTFSTGNYSYQAVYSSGSNLVYVPSYAYDNVTIVSGTTPIGIVGVGGSPYYATYDPVANLMLVMNAYTGTVSVLSGTSVVATIPIGAYSYFASVDPLTGAAYVTSYSAYTATLLDFSTGSTVEAIGIAGGSASTTFTTTVPEITAVPDSGPAGTSVTVDGTGFSANSTVTLSFRSALIESCTSGSLTTNATGVFSCTFAALEGATTSVNVGTAPEYPGYDSGNGYVYVPNRSSDNVSVLDGSVVVGTVNVGAQPQTALYDPSDGDVYVLNSGSSNVSVLSGTALIGTLPVGSYPLFGVYDPADQEVYVLNYYGTNMTVLSGLTIVGSVATGSNPAAAVYDSQTQQVYVAAYGASLVSIVQGTTVVSLVTVPYPYGEAFDAASGDVYVTSVSEDAVYILAGNSVVAVAPVGSDPYAAAYDPVTGLVYVTNYYSDNVSVFNGTVLVATVAVGYYPYLALPVGRVVYVVNYYSQSVSVLSGEVGISTLLAGAYPIGIVQDVAHGSIDVTNAGGTNVTVFSGAAAGGISAIDPTGVAALAPFAATLAEVSTTPADGVPGSTVDLSATGLAPDTAYEVYLDPIAGTPATYLTTLDSSLTGTITEAAVSVPVLLGAGTYSIDLFEAVSSDFIASSSSTFTLLPLLSFLPSAGAVGSTLTLSGHGFTAGDLVTPRFAGGSLACQAGPTSVGANGAFTCSIVVPAASSGSYAVAASTSGDGVVTASGSFTVDPLLTLSLSGGPVGASLTATGSGFASGATVSLVEFGGTTVSCTGGAPTVSGSGAFTCTFGVPASPSGSYSVHAYDSVDGSVASATSFAVSASWSFTSTSGTLPATLTASGSGFLADRAITFSPVVAGAASLAYAACETGATGSFSCTIYVTAAPSAAEHFTASDGTNAPSSSTTFTAVASWSFGPASGILPASVTATGTGFVSEEAITFAAVTTGVELTQGGCTTNATGGFACTFTLTASPHSAQYFTASDGTNAPASTTSFTASPSISVTPASGKVASSATVTGSGFAGGEGVTFTLDGVTMPVTSGGGSCTEGSSGSFSCAVTVPANPAGSETLVADDGASVSASTSFTVVPSLLITGSTSGWVGNSTTLTGTGFTASATISLVQFGASPANTTTVSCSGGAPTVGAYGGFTCTLTVPQAPHALYDLTAYDASDGTVGSANSFKVVANYAISVDQGPKYSELTISGTGEIAQGRGSYFGSSFLGVVVLAPTGSCTLGTPYTANQTVRPNANGQFSCAFVVPAVSAGTYIVTTGYDNSGYGPLTFLVTTPAISASLPSGPVNSMLTVEGSGFTVSNSVGLSFLGVLIESCPNAGALTTSASGTFSCSFDLPSGTSGSTITATDDGSSPMDQATTSFVLTTASLTVTPTSAGGEPLALSGSGYAPSTQYNYCYEATSVATGCSASLQFTSTAGGAIPSVGAPTISLAEAGYVDLSQGTSSANWISSVAAYAVSFSESGVPGSVGWTNDFDDLGAYVWNAGSATYFVTNGSYAYAITAPAGYVLDSSTPASPVSVDGAGRSISVGFFATYAVTFQETGLPLSWEGWTVALTGPGGQCGLPTVVCTASGSTSTLTFELPNGTGANDFGVEVSSTNGYYGADPAGAPLTVNGAATGRSVAFTAYVESVTLSPSGLPSWSSVWFVNLTTANSTVFARTGSVGSPLVFSAFNGTRWVVNAYQDYFAPRPASGSVSGITSLPDPVSETVTFAAVAGTVTFREFGLPTGTAWYLNLTSAPALVPLTLSGPITAQTYALSGSTALVNGSYGYTSSTANPQYGSDGGGSLVSSAGGVLPASPIVVAFTRSLYTVTVTETGLPGGRLWSATVNGATESSTGSSIAFPRLVNGSYAWNVTPIAGWSVPVYGGSVTVAGANAQESVTFGRFTYSVTIAESGLPGGTAWALSVNGTILGSSSSTLVFAGLVNGTHPYTVANVPGFSLAGSYSGTLAIAGPPADPALTLSFSPRGYAVTFTESGLPSGTVWWANLTSGCSSGCVGTSSGPTITLSAPNGTYGFGIGSVAGYRTSPWSGTVRVAGGSVALGIPFVVTTYAVTFTESRSTATWGVQIAGSLLLSSTTSITFSLTNGSGYGYAILPSVGFTTPSPSGSFSVAGAPLARTITMDPIVTPYTLLFTATGLLAGTSWSVAVTGPGCAPCTAVSRTNLLAFSEPNGTYAWTVGGVPGYTPASSHGTATLAGIEVSLGVIFAPTTYAVTFSESPLASPSWAVTLAASNGSLFKTGASSSIAFQVVNGSWSYTIAPPSGYAVLSATPAGPITISGSGSTVSVTLVAAPAHGSVVGPRPAPSALAWLFGPGLGLSLLLRRRRPA